MTDKQTNIIVSGFGGQGVLFLGTILSHAAIIERKNTTWIPSYGAEMRGGSANCYVVISKEEIASPIFDEADLGIFLSKQAMEKFEDHIATGGLIIADSSRVGDTQTRNDIEYCEKPFNTLVLEQNKKTGILSKENVLIALKKVSEMKKPEFIDLNIKSFEFGYSLI